MVDAKPSTKYMEFSSSDPEQASEAVSGIFLSARYSALTRDGDFALSIRMAHVDDVCVWQSSSSTGFLLTTEATRHPAFDVHFIEAGHCSSTTKNDVIEASAGDALLLRELGRHDVICQPNTSRLCVAIPSTRYLRLVAGEFGNPFGDLSALHSVANCGLPGIRSLKQAAKLLISICGSEPAGDGSSIGAHLLTEAFLALFIESWPRDGRCRNKQAARPFYIKRAIEWMHLHAAQKISLEDLSAASGVSVRTLQLGFQTYSGMSPMAYLFKIRLDGAYRDLLTEQAHVTIDEIARRWGFLNPGKFAGHIRLTYGQNPFAIRRALIRSTNEI